MRDKSVFLKKEDCVDLPPKVFEVKRFSLEKEQNKYYQDMLQNIKDNINEWSKFEFTAKLMKLREIVSGFVINKDGTITDFDTSKNKVLEDCFEEVGDKPVIVWCQFQHEIEQLAEKYNGVGLTSKTKNRDDVRSGLGFKYQICLANTIGVVDADYYFSNNEGHIFIKLVNRGDKSVHINLGDAFAQGIFMEYGITEDDHVETSRNGGFGSTDKNKKE